MEKYVDIKIDYTIPFGTLSEFYHSQGVFNIVDERKAELGIPNNAILPATIVRANDFTQKKLLAQWEKNWREYNYNHHTGEHRGTKLIKLKRPQSLNQWDINTLSFNFYLGIGPGNDNSLPDDIMRIRLDWDEKEISYPEEV